jgi:hypothetical protein
MINSPLPRARPSKINDGPRVLNMPGGLGRFLPREEILGIGNSITENEEGCGEEEEVNKFLINDWYNDLN